MDDDEQDEEGMAGYELIMPFVACLSEGGPFDDDAFTAGFTVGMWYERLGNLTHGCVRIEICEPIRTDLVPQFDLLAMRFDWKLTPELVDGMPEWSTVVLEKVSDG